MVVTPYYPPNHTAAGTRMSNLVKRLAKEEIIERVDVLIWNPHFRYPPILENTDRKVHITISRIGEDTLGRAFKHHDPNPIFALIWFFITAFHSMVLKPDRVIFTSPPGVVMFGSAWCRIVRTPYVLDYRDFWQDRNKQAIKKIGGITGSVARLPVRFIEWFARGADAAALIIVAVHKKIGDKLHDGISQPPILMSNGINVGDVQNAISMATSSKIESLFKGRRVIAYVGQLGLTYYSPEIILEPMCKLSEENPDIELWIFSSTLDSTFKNAVTKAGLENKVKYFNLPHIEMLAMLRHAIVGLIPLRSEDSQVNYVFPAKLYDYLSSGLPILALSNKESYISSFITEYGIGINVKWGSKTDIYNALKELLINRTFKLKAEEQSDCFCKMFDREVQFKEFNKKLTKNNNH